MTQTAQTTMTAMPVGFDEKVSSLLSNIEVVVVTIVVVVVVFEVVTKQENKRL